MQCMVEKRNGSVEVYLHTKVLGTLSEVLGLCGCCQEGLAEQLSEGLTTYVSRQHPKGLISSDEILAMIEAVLSETGYTEAAVLLHENHIQRQIRRDRTEIIRPIDYKQQGLDEWLGVDSETIEYRTEPWDKSVLAEDLEAKRNLPHGIARAVAGAVEEKILNLGYRQVQTRLIEALVGNELWAMRQSFLPETASYKEKTESPSLLAAV